MPFVYLIKAQSDDGDKSIVVGHVATQKQAEKVMRDAERIDVAPVLAFEGPVQADKWPIGTIIDEESDDD